MLRDLHARGKGNGMAGADVNRFCERFCFERGAAVFVLYDYFFFVEMTMDEFFGDADGWFVQEDADIACDTHFCWMERTVAVNKQ